MTPRIVQPFVFYPTGTRVPFQGTNIGLAATDDASASFCSVHHVIEIPSPQPDSVPQQEIIVTDLTKQIQSLVTDSGLREGVATIFSRHTTTAICINEYEQLLLQYDVPGWLRTLAPADERSNHAVAGVRYRHNDIDSRPASDDEKQRCEENGWAVTTDPAALHAWREQEPINAHTHLHALSLGASEAVPVSAGRLTVGQWQSILLVDCDGPRSRQVGVQLMGVL